MTIEGLIGREEAINLQKLHVADLDISDVIDNNSDIDVSAKLVDEDGNIVMIIEAMPMNISHNEDSNNERGCFIRRFEFTECLVNTQPWTDCFISFGTGVRYKMELGENDMFVSYYKYVWAKMPRNEQCVVADVLGMEEFADEDEAIIYKLDLLK